MNAANASLEPRDPVNQQSNHKPTQHGLAYSSTSNLTDFFFGGSPPLSSAAGGRLFLPPFPSLLTPTDPVPSAASFFAFAAYNTDISIVRSAEILHTGRGEKLTRQAPTNTALRPTPTCFPSSLAAFIIVNAATGSATFPPLS